MQQTTSNLSASIERSPLIIAHRGASAFAPENTLAAFDLALAHGADGIEFDVRLSADGVPVVIHDADLRRVGGRRELISSLTAAALSECDVGSWFNRQFPSVATGKYGAQRIPTLEQFLSQHSRGKKLYLEMKADKALNPQLVREIAQLIDRFNLREDVTVLSFDLTGIKLLKEVDAGIRTGALFQPRLFRAGSPLLKATMIRRALAVGAAEIALNRLLATPRIINDAQSAGLKVVVWTVDNPAWLEFAGRLGVHAIITNNPRAMRAGSTQIAKR